MNEIKLINPPLLGFGGWIVLLLHLGTIVLVLSFQLLFSFDGDMHLNTPLILA